MKLRDVTGGGNGGSATEHLDLQPTVAALLCIRSLAMSLSLNCLVLGDDPEKAFNIEIHKNKSVSHLKDLIKEKRSSRLKDVDASDLDLWQVSFHFDDLDSELANIDLSAHQKLSPPIKRLTTFFTDVEDDCLHVIVRAPGTSRQFIFWTLA